jgi:intracellular septation protein A
MDQATIQILIVVAMVLLLVWWQNREIPATEWLFGEEVTVPGDSPASTI